MINRIIGSDKPTGDEAFIVGRQVSAYVQEYSGEKILVSGFTASLYHRFDFPQYHLL